MVAARTYTDATGGEHPRATGAVRIVSLVPSLTELLCALGLAEQIVGRTGFCIHPAATVAKIPKIGGTKDVKIEAVRRLAPTHVVVNVDENLRETAEALRAFVPRVIVTHPQAPEDNRALYALLGGIFAREARARALASRFDAALAAARDQARGQPARKVLYVIWRAPWMTVSRDTYISRTLALFGLHTVPEHAAERYPQFDFEAATREADLVLLPTEPYPFRERHVEELRAACEGRVRPHLIDGEMVSWYGSRAIDGLDYLAAWTRRLAETSVC